MLSPGWKLRLDVSRIISSQLAMFPVQSNLFQTLLLGRGGIPKVVPPLLHEGTLGGSRAGDAQSTLGVKKVSENATPKVTSLDPQIGPKILPNRIKMSLKLSLRGGRRQVLKKF